MKTRVIISSTYSIVKLLASFFWIYVTFGWKVRKARNAFEKQLTTAGMSQSDAKRLSQKYSMLKDNILNSGWAALTKSRIGLHKYSNRIKRR